MRPGARLLSRLWRDYLWAHRGWLLLALVLMTVEGAALGALSYLVRPMFDQVFVAGDEGAVGLIAGAVFAVFLARAGAGFVQRSIVVTTGLKVITAIQRNLAAHLLTLDLGFFLANAPGGLIERVRGDAQALQRTASGALMTLGRDLTGLISLLAVALWIDWQWALLVFAGVPVLVLPLIALQRRIRGRSRNAREASAVISTRLDEIFHGMMAVKVNALEAHERGRFARAVDRFYHAQRDTEVGQAALPALIDLLAAVGFLVVLLVGGGQIVAGEKTVGEFMSFFTAIALVFDPLRRLSMVSGQIQAALASLERLYSLFDARPRIPAAPAGARPAPAPAGDIAFRDVHFAYDDQPVLRGLSFTAEEGRTTALVGPSGAGKSTVFNLLARLIEPQSGCITLGGTDIAEVAPASLRAGLALVSQDAALFDEPIRENIRLGRLDASDAEVEEAARRASVTEFAAALPGGLDAPAGPRGATLSGGQRQRVAIARAMLRDAPILLLDEPTSALDARSEGMIQAALADLSRGRTTLVIAHRLSTIRDADRILVLEGGRLLDQGRHEELLARGGLYAQLHALQAADAAGG